MYKSLKQGYLFSEPIYYMLRLSNILLTGSVPQVNTSNHAPYFSILILFNHECFVQLSMSVFALRAYALNKCIMMDLMCHVVANEDTLLLMMFLGRANEQDTKHLFCVHAAQTGKHLLRTQNVSDKNQKHFLCLGHKNLCP